MGVIYAAEHVATEEKVALKVLWPQVLGSKAAVENFQLEARIAARLGGEHIVRIFDAGFDEAGGLPYLAMELLQGQTLDDLVTSRGPLRPAEALWVMRQVARALERAHGYVDRKGRPAPIVHRDLKPENLFLAATEGGATTVKVLDFGVAKVLSQSQKLSQELRGTPLFMASEQIEGGPVTPQLDVWALGLIAYYLLTGRYYWRSASRPEAGLSLLFHEILQKPLEAPSDRLRSEGVTPPWPPAFDAWFLHCVHRDPAERFFPAGTAIEALAEALGVDEARPVRAAGAASPWPQYVSAPCVTTPGPAPGDIARVMASWNADPSAGPASGREGGPAAISAATLGEGPGASFSDSVVQMLTPPRPSARRALRRRPWGTPALALVTALGSLLTVSLGYRYLTMKPSGAAAQGDTLPITPLSDLAPGRPAGPPPPFADASARPEVGTPSGPPSAASSANAPPPGAPVRPPTSSRGGGAPKEGRGAPLRPEPERPASKSQAKPTEVFRPDPYEYRGD